MLAQRGALEPIGRWRGDARLTGVVAPPLLRPKTAVLALLVSEMADSSWCLGTIPMSQLILEADRESGEANLNVAGRHAEMSPL